MLSYVPFWKMNYMVPLATGSNEESSVQLNCEACGHRVVDRGLLLYSARCGNNLTIHIFFELVQPSHGRLLRWHSV